MFIWVACMSMYIDYVGHIQALCMPTISVTFDQLCATVLAVGDLLYDGFFSSI